MRRAVFASMLAVSCAAARPPEIAIPAPPPSLQPEAARPSLFRRLPLPEPHAGTRISSSGMTLVLDGRMLRAYVDVSDESGAIRSVEKPEVDFFIFDPVSRKWDPIPGCQGVEVCDTSPFNGRYRIRARFSQQGLEPITGEFSP